MTTNDKTWFEKQVNRELFRQTLKETALSQVGYDETPVNRTPYGKWYGMDGNAWCLTGDTLVLCPEGYRRIDEIEVGDYVIGGITGEARRVSAVASRSAEVQTLRFSGASLNITDEHPILVGIEGTTRQQKTKTVNASTQRGMLPETSWVPVGHLDLSKSKIEPNAWRRPMAALSRHSGDLWPVTEEQAYVLGMYVADGHTTKRSRGRSVDVCISDAPHEAERIRKALSAAGAGWNEYVDRTTIRFSLKSGPLKSMTSEFGTRSTNKTIGSVFSWASPLRDAFLRGYLDGDGSIDGKCNACTTVSFALATGIAHLLRINGHHPAISVAREAGVMTIEGRKVNVNKTYSLQWVESSEVAQQNRQFYNEPNRQWVHIKSKSAKSMATVFDLTVEKDHAFVANGVIVHNCAMFVSWCYGMTADKLNVPNPLTVLGAKGFAHVTSTWARIVDKHPQWMLAQNDTPMPGDIFFWDHDSRAGGPGHTELYVRHISRKNLVITGLWVGGNTNSGFSRTGGSVCSHLHPVKVGKVGAHGYLLGVARPTREFWTAKP